MNKSKRIEIRVNLFDEKLIRVKAKDSGLSVSEYVRKCALNKPVPRGLDPDELETYKDLKKYYSNFRSISNLFKSGNDTDMISEIEELQKELKNHLNRIYHGKQSKIS